MGACTAEHCCIPLNKTCADTMGDGTNIVFICGFEQSLRPSVQCGDGTSSAVCDEQTCCAASSDEFLQKSRKDRSASPASHDAADIESADKAATVSSVAFVISSLAV